VVGTPGVGSGKGCRYHGAHKPNMVKRGAYHPRYRHGGETLAMAFRDAYPVTELHTLIVPKRHVADHFDLFQPERNAMQALMEDQRRQIIEADASVTGFNIGINAGKDAGQTIFHCHMHLIPRRVGDVEDPRGGVRGVIPSKQKY